MDSSSGSTPDTKPGIGRALKRSGDVVGDSKTLSGSYAKSLKDLEKWASKEEYGALGDVFSGIAEIAALQLEVQREQIEMWSEFRKVFETILDNDRNELKKKSGSKKSSSSDITDLSEKLKVQEAETEIQKKSVSTLTKENEAIKLMLTKKGFENLHELPYEGSVHTTRIVLDAKERMKNYRRCDSPPVYTSNPPPPPFNPYYGPPLDNRNSLLYPPLAGNQERRQMGKNKHKKHHRRDEDGGMDCSEIRGGKGLKLILKVGGSTPETLESMPHKKKKKKKDKKRRHHHREKRSKREDLEPNPAEDVEMEEENESEVSEESPIKRLLDYLLPLLQKRDEPMDFTTMRSKLDNGDYLTMEAFKSDFELMCNNAMVYNTQGTVYYKAAKKLLALGQRVFTPEKLRPLREHLSFMNELGEKELGFDLDTIPDDLSPEEILAFAKEKANEAADKAKKKKTELGFLRQNPDGTTSLSFLTGGDGVIPGTNNERPVLLGSLIGKVKQGTGSIQGFKEDRNNAAKAVYPLYYGAFSSHGPSYDSTFANLTQDETELVYSTYGDDVGVKYAESIMNFGRDCDYAMFIVDHLLDILTGNEHRKTSKYIEEQKNLRKEEDLLDKVFAKVDPNFDLESLKSLEKEGGIDKNFLDSLKKEYEVKGEDQEGEEAPSDSNNQDNEDEEEGDKEENPVDILRKNAALIKELTEVQRERLSSNPPPHYGQMPKTLRERANSSI
ncbi:BRD7 [Lepeophtheirus salmonis]|uniref:BRD7 n=1 Tax=Lepeophtheirus salmonis TaxID=72036 RepID=A0A7R8CFE7_LEPSM|nr:BRD7 [Lepeophtheirus salmonis]CAF2765498.1 BRD7 [Lepeophtheirus salmonis]